MHVVVRHLRGTPMCRTRRVGVRVGAVLQEGQAREAEPEHDADDDAREVGCAHGRTLPGVGAVTCRASMTVRTLSTIVGR